MLDLDYRPMFWADAERRRASGCSEALAHVTVAVGNLEECEVAVGETRPGRGRAGAAGPRRRARRRQAGPEGRARAAPATSGSRCRRVPVEVVNGLGAGDAFGGALCHGLLAGWPLERILRFANAAGAIVASRLECSTAMPTTAEVDAAAGQRRRARLLSRDASTCDPCEADPSGTDVRARRRGGRRGRRRRAGARPLLGDDGRLMIVAADHPARGALGVARRAAGDGRPRRPARPAGASRWPGPGVDGVLGTPDILEDLLLLGALDDKVVIGSMNRGGLQGAAFELDDRFTGYDAGDDRRAWASTAARC